MKKCIVCGRELGEKDSNELSHRGLCTHLMGHGYYENGEFKIRDSVIDTLRAVIEKHVNKPI